MAVESNYYGSIFVRDRLAITVTVSLVVIAAVCWIASYYLMPFMMMSSNSAGMGMTNGVAAIVGSTFSLSSVLFFDLLWVIGMAAMMFPAMIPVMLFYNKVAVNAEEHPKVARILGTPVFLIGYLAMYAVLGIGAVHCYFLCIDGIFHIFLAGSCSDCCAERSVDRYGNLSVLFPEEPVPFTLHLSHWIFRGAFEARYFGSGSDGFPSWSFLRGLLLGVHAGDVGRGCDESTSYGDPVGSNCSGKNYRAGICVV